MKGTGGDTETSHRLETFQNSTCKRERKQGTIPYYTVTSLKLNNDNKRKKMRKSFPFRTISKMWRISLLFAF
jgi:hypothetical protein